MKSALGPLVLLVPLLFLLLGLGHAWVPTHDTQKVLQLFRFFASTLGSGEGIPTWSPFLSFGTSLNLFVLTQMSPAMLLLLPLGKLIPSLDAAKLFYFALFLEECVFALGLLALTGRYFRSAWLRAFVTLSLVAATDWTTQIYFNFRLISCLPLALYLVQRGIEERSVRHLLYSAAAVAFPGLCGSALYLIVPQGLALAVFGGTVWWREKERKLPWRSWSSGESLAVVLTVAALLVPVLYALTPGVPAFLSPGRDAIGGAIQYESYLGSASEPHQALRLLEDPSAGVRANDSIGLFAGSLFLPLVILALIFMPFTPQAPWLVLSGFFLLMSFGASSFVAPLLYFIPGINQFRFLAFVTPIVKLGMVFLAGFGLEAVGRALRGELAERKALWRIFLSLQVLLIVATCAYFGLAHKAGALSSIPRAVLAWIFRIALLVICLRFALQPQRNAQGATAVLVLLTIFELVGYRTWLYHTKLAKLPSEERAYYRTSTMRPGLVRQAAFDDKSLRFKQLLERPNGFVYDYVTAAFLGKEVCSLRAISEVVEPSVQWLAREMHKPTAGTLAAARCGLEKVAIYDRLETFEDFPKAYEATQSLARAPLTTTKQAMQRFEREWKKMNAEPWSGPKETRSVASQPKVTVHRLQSETLQATASAPAGGWFLFADSWSPGWKAKVNGRPTPILEAGYGFKAVPLEPGDSTIEMRLPRPLTKCLTVLLWLLSLAYVSLSLRWSWREVH